MKRLLGGIVLALTAIITGTVSVYNSHPVTFNSPLGSTEHYLVVFLAAALVLGIMLGVLASLAVILRLKTELRRTRKQVRVREQEIENLRSIPFKEQD